MKSVVLLLGILFLVPALSQEGYLDFEAGFKAGYEGGSWEYRDYNFNLSASAPSDSVSGYNAGYMLAKGVPIFMPCGGDSKRYNEGFKEGYVDGSWEYRDYNFNLSGRMKSADEGFFSGYVNGYVLGHMEKKGKAEKTKLENQLSALNNENKNLDDRAKALEARAKDLEDKTRVLEDKVKELESRLNVLEKKQENKG